MLFILFYVYIYLLKLGNFFSLMAASPNRQLPGGGRNSTYHWWVRIDAQRRWNYKDVPWLCAVGYIPVTHKLVVSTHTGVLCSMGS